MKLQDEVAIVAARIVETGSRAGQLMTFLGSAAYTTAKHAVHGWGLHFTRELADSHITVNSISAVACLIAADTSKTPEPHHA